MDELGTPSSYNHYAVGWAWAMYTPYQWTKQVASHWGGTRNGTIVHWPTASRSKGGLRSPVHPRHRRRADDPRGRRPARADDGQRRAAVADGGHEHALRFDEADAPERHDLQYFEMFGNRGIYHKGWSAVTKHRTPWVMVGRRRCRPFDDDVWELYDGSADYSQARDLVGRAARTARTSCSGCG